MSVSSMTAALFAPRPTSESVRERPGKVVSLHGVIIQSDAISTLGRLFIRPLEALDLWYAGVANGAKSSHNGGEQRAGLGMHAGLHVRLEDGREFVLEQLCGGWREWFVNGLHWTPLNSFQARERPDAGGWSVTIPTPALRQVDSAMEAFAISHLNDIRGRPFIREDCTAFIARVFGPKRRIFADSPILRSLGFEMRSGEPALPLLRRNAELPPRHEALLKADALRRLPDPVATSGSMSIRQLHHRLIITSLVCAALTFLAAPALGARGTRRRQGAPWRRFRG